MQTPTGDNKYHLIYWPGTPGRGEFIRLALEEAGAPYRDTAHEEGGLQVVRSHVDKTLMGDWSGPPPYAPPILKHGDLVISQTANILLYLGPRLGLVPTGDAVYHVNALTLTALDGLSDEVHECHHPIAMELYYEDQLEESKRRSKCYLQNRLPKFLSYFERVLKSQKALDQPWLYGTTFTYADLVLFQCIDGVKFAFPKAVGKLEQSAQYVNVFTHYEAVKNRPRIKQYLSSDRRQKYSMDIWRHYPELDNAE
ncbi:hypothetical protein CNMCM8927_008723 [Aspergillus lentulus]|uniref:Glutathione S-transferase n=1 Tax=Aspergillus lentulus TaxID=293939 RepID=A0AAN5YVD3_ASPLE|nr:hypothetical protein CNMCM6069_009424 [Aspergillus lentulus]KAF4189872.1 hypothetical protein CNMCM7927_006656 [Aspergillus lentulus]KAF4208774.1 hypothetical protein CNMCM8927_008723 [Aspergillus lentulus]